MPVRQPAFRETHGVGDARSQLEPLGFGGVVGEQAGLVNSVSDVLSP
ncbi:MAG: hypothetical protein U5Q03_15005 [Bacteroidota bacterium]|nr:hypothetical protein [Bacteroidota bacterium]